ncbi:LPXTG cell wall anchor domain-containing protein [Clostridium sp. Sa3CUN1]|uniref:LPXTG cell wall anchor domain-containing protein n=1 Tax=Clostridium gallinarum TaxID=2762246 RepID=A0ABR8Q3T6_9CLOT|nr:LPXTG cell wall anchor domain-containing protein [Clostridium gallinarum]
MGEDKDPETQIENAKVYNNTFISNKDAHPVYKGNEVTYTNNIWYFTNSNLASRTSPFDFGENSTFNNNVYYGINQPNKNGISVDSNAKVINPQFMNENIFSNSKDEVFQAVKLKSISPLIGSGVSLEDNGGLDFYGYSIIKGNINIGAYNGLGHETVKVPYSVNSTSDEVKKYLSSGDLQTDVINETPIEANSKWVNTTFNQEPLVYTKSNGAYVKFEWSGTGITPILKSGAGAGEGVIEVYTKDNMSTPFKVININTYSENPNLIKVKDFENMFEKDTDCIIIVKNSSTSQKALNVVKFNVDVNESLSSECEVNTLENVFMNSGKYVISYYDDSISIPLTSSYAIDSCKEINSEVVTTYKVISGEGIITGNTLIANNPGIIEVEVTVEYKEQIVKKQAQYVVTKAKKPQVNEKPVDSTIPKAGTYEAEDKLVNKSGTFVTIESSTASKGTQLKTDKKDDSIGLSFYGNKISVYGRKAVGTAILRVEVYLLEDGEETLIETKEVDCYRDIMEDQALIYEKEFDLNNSYKIKVLNTRTQNPSANGSYNMIIDYFVVEEKMEGIEVNKDELIKTLEQAEAINLDNYTDESTAALIDLIENAKILLNDESALQEDIDKLKIDILEAIDNLIEKEDNIVLIDKEALEIVIDYAEEVKINGGLENVVPAVFNEFESALEEAKIIFDKEYVSQEEVDTVIKRLVEAIHMLDFKQGDKTQLIKLVKIINALEKDKYKPSTWSTLELQLSEANMVIEDENAMEEEVAKTYKKLVKAYLDLRLIPNKEKLEELINKAKVLDLTKYTEDSVEIFKIALSRATEVLNNNEINEVDVEIATNNLVKSIDNLVAKSDDSSKNDKNTEESNKEENNNGDNGNNDKNDVNNGGTKNNGNKENNKLPTTGGIDTIYFSTVSIISILLGAILSKKKR